MEELSNVVLRAWEQVAADNAAICNGAIENLQKDRDEWMQRALAAEKQLDVVASRLVDLVYTP